ncbi:MAG: aminopeptidase P family protein [Firmicutes bacterium]|nr:aminopeptidase P family protein [Bacillota bacterium]
MDRFPFLTKQFYPYSIAPEELERRQKATLAEMEKQGIDVLVMQTNIGWLGGAFSYLTDIHCQSYPYYGLFSKYGVEVYGHGVHGTDPMPPYLKPVNTCHAEARPYVPSITQIDYCHASDMCNSIKEHGFKKIGLVGMGYITANVYKYLTENLPDCEFVNASEITDHLRACKSDYELELFMNCIHIHDRVLAAAPALLQPGRTEYEVVTDINNIAFKLGCPICNVMIGSHPTHPQIKPYQYTNKVIDKDDTILILFELCTPWYTWGEVGRMFSFKKPSDKVMDAYKQVLEAQDYNASLSVPGAQPSEILAKLNEKLTGWGYAPEQRLGLHSQSCDIVDRPTWTPEETMPLEENMFFANHPGCGNKEVFTWVCDNYLVKPGGAVRLNECSRDLVWIK